MASVDRNLERTVAYVPAVRDAVRAELDTRATRVRAVVNAHRYTGELASSLTVETDAVDSTVSIADPNVLAINYGHWTAGESPTHVEGIHAIEAGL